MGWLESLVLAVVQGLTEFLPVSSSGHLVLTQALFGNFPADSLAFDLVLHLGTALAAALFYRREVGAVLRGLLPPYAGAAPATVEARRLLLLLVVATVPTGVIGLVFKDGIEGLFSSPGAVAGNLAVTGLVLLAMPALRPGDTPLGRAAWWKAALVGVAQGIAVAPGISRSGSTIAAGLALGLRREDAVRFSFLLSLPAIAGASLLELRHGLGPGPGTPEPARYALGFAAAAATGYLAILLVLRWTRAGRLWIFGAYCLAVAGAAAALLAGR